MRAWWRRRAVGGGLGLEREGRVRRSGGGRWCVDWVESVFIGLYLLLDVRLPSDVVSHSSCRRNDELLLAESAMYDCLLDLLLILLAVFFSFLLFPPPSCPSAPSRSYLLLLTLFLRFLTKFTRTHHRCLSQRTERTRRWSLLPYQQKSPSIMPHSSAWAGFGLV
jgi:hypothetical protein